MTITENLDTNLVQSIYLIHEILTELSSDKSLFDSILFTAFGNNINIEIAESLRQQWSIGDFQDIPLIEIWNQADLNGANGAFSLDTGKIYLASEFIKHNANNLKAISQVLLEEIGHYIDAEINLTDTQGDEGAIFSSLVRGTELTPEELRVLRQEDDRATIILDGEEINIEQSAGANNPNPDLDGVFGNDNRTRVTNTTSDPWRKVGFVKARFGDQWYGSSGVMIGPHHFLTSAHGIFNSTRTDDGNNGGYADEIHIYLGQDGQEKYYGQVGVTKFHTVKGYTGDNDGDGVIADNDPDENEWNYDWAVLNLDRNIGNHTGWMVWQWSSNLSWYNGLDVNITGYPSRIISSDGTVKKNWSGSFAGTEHSAEMYTISGKLNSADNYQLEYTLDQTGGNSGGPVWRSEGNTEYVLGVVTGVIGKPPERNEALRLQKYITDNIEDWKKNDTTPIDKPDLVDYDEWFGTDFAYFRNYSTVGSDNNLSNLTLDVKVGDSVGVRSRIRNNGTARSRVEGFNITEPRIDVYYYASTDKNINSLDYKIGQVNISAIDPFKWSDAILTTTFPNIPEGNYYIGYTFSSIMSEFDTSNNKGIIDDSRIKVIHERDLKVIHERDLSGASFDVIQEPLDSGDSFDVNFKIQNTEVGNTSGFYVDFYISTDNTITTSDRKLGSYWLNGLAGNSTTNTLSKTLTLPSQGDSFWSNGDNDYYIGMIVDGTKRITESNESNNSGRGEFIDYDKVFIDKTFNLEPVAVDDFFDVEENNTLTINAIDGVLKNDTDGNRDNLTVSLSNDVSNGDLSLNHDGSFTYTPDADFDGIDGFSYNVSDGNGGSDTATVTIAVERDRIISISDLILAPGATTDIPVTIDNVERITKLEFDLHYDTDLLDITEVNLNNSLPTSWQFTESEIDSDNGIVSVTIKGTDALAGDNLNIVNLKATAPDTASYGETQILDLANVMLNDGNINAIDDDGIHKVIQAGDTTGDGTLKGLDAYHIMRLSVGLDDNFDLSTTVDPIISADMNGDGVISAFDAYLAVKS